MNELVAAHIPPNAYAEQWNTAELKREVQRIFALDLPIDEWAAEEGIADQEITERLMKEVDEKAAPRQAEFGPETLRQIEKMVLLQTLDHLWREHLVTLEHLRQVIGFRSYGQRDPLNEYKSEASILFETHARQPARGGHRPAHAHPVRARGGAALIEPVELPPMQAHHVDPFTGKDELAMADAALAAGRPRRATLAERRAPLQTRRAGRRRQSRRIRRRGARSRATRCARAARARSTSTATASTTNFAVATFGSTVCGRKTALA